MSLTSFALCSLLGSSESETDQLLLEGLSVQNPLALRATVLIELVSANRLRKTGIFAETAGDFWPFPLRLRETGSPETKPNAQKPGISGCSCVDSGARVNAGMLGWGGRDRTSEWRNQNPLPYRLATPQQAGNREDRPDRLRQRRSIGGVEPFQQPIGQFSG